MREAIDQQRRMMRGIEIVARFRHREEFDGDDMRALVEQLEDGMLRVIPTPPQVIAAVGPSTGVPSAFTLLPLLSISSCWR